MIVDCAVRNIAGNERILEFRYLRHVITLNRQMDERGNIEKVDLYHQRHS